MNYVSCEIFLGHLLAITRNSNGRYSFQTALNPGLSDLSYGDYPTALEATAAGRQSLTQRKNLGALPLVS